MSADIPSEVLSFFRCHRVDKIGDGCRPVDKVEDGCRPSICGVGGTLLQSELGFRDVVMVEGLLHDHPPGGEVTVQAVADVVRAVQNHVDEGNLWHVKGRPQIPISEEQLVTLLELRFPNVDIATMLQVSPRTVRRRIIQYRLQEEASFTVIRCYHVCMPNSLWHIDGHHKLIRWRIIVHGGIDGYSRLPMYLQLPPIIVQIRCCMQCFLML